MRIAKLRVKDWKCYRGEHELLLGPKVYAIVAQREDDRDSSNWAGKSSLMEAVDWVLHGRLPKGTAKDDVITHSASKTECEVELTDGSRVVRCKERGKPEKLWYWPGSARGGKPMMKQIAQAAILDATCLSAEDALATWYFRQRQLARLVLADAGERLEIVGGWLRLEKLQAAEDVARARLSDASAKIDEAVRQARSWTERADTIRSEHGKVPDLRLAQLDEEVADLRAALEEARAAMVGAAERANLEQQARRYEQVVGEGKTRAHTAPKPEHVEVLRVQAADKSRAAAEAAAESRAASKAARSKRSLVTEGFDGTCPLVGTTCPSHKWVGEQRVALEQQAQIAEDEVVRLVSSGRMLEAEAEEAAGALRRDEEALQKLEALRAEARALYPAFLRHKELAGGAEAPADLPALQRELERLLNARTIAVRAADELQAAEKHAAAWAEKADELRKGAQASREAVLVLGKNGAQRRIAEGALSQIQVAANGKLAHAGIPLSLNLRWAREGAGAATACDRCGAPFPKSERVKECERCAAPRGPNLVHRLEVELSDRSGAAEDLAGAALQLAAGDWLRADRASPWGVAMIDEPFGQLDKSLRTAFASHLAAMLRSTYEQSFVIAHSPDVLDALPGRILVTASANGSRVEVVA